MGYYGKIDQKLKAQQMRKEGKSYTEILQILRISKSTVSQWCKDIELTQEQLEKLYSSKKAGALRGSIIAAKNKQQKSLLSSEIKYEEGIREVGLLSQRDRFMAGIAFYISEGTKVNKTVCFTNSDPLMVKFMVEWFQEFGHVPLLKFRGAIWIHSGLNEKRAKEYWSSLTGIPLSNFYKSYIAERKDKSRKIRKQLHEFGVFSFYIGDVMLLRKIMGWGGGILKKPWYNGKAHLHSPVAQR